MKDPAPTWAQQACALRGHTQQAARELKIHKTVRVRGRHKFTLHDGNEKSLQGGLIGHRVATEEGIDVLSRDPVQRALGPELVERSAALARLGDLEDGQQRVPLLRVLAHDRQRDMRPAAAETGEIFDPMLGLTRDDVQSG